MIQDVRAEIDKISESGSFECDAEAFDDFESNLQKLTHKLNDLIAAKVLQKKLMSQELIQKSIELAKTMPQKFKNYGYRLTPVRMANGTIVEMCVIYFARACNEKKPNKRGKGMYPGLTLLGVFDKCTPGLASEVSMAAAALSSLKEAQDMLAARECYLDIKSIRNIVKRFAARARCSQERGKIPISSSEIVDARVVISIDGGRIRIRTNKPGKKTKKGRRHYHTNWREPKLFIIYLVDQNGQMEKKFQPLIDATLNGPEEIFSLLGFYLDKLKVCNASSVTFIADGALWIWKRAQTLLNLFGIKTEKVHLILDFYHAIEHLAALLELKKWPAADRKIYLKKYRRKLLKGKTEEFFGFIESLTRRSRNSEVIREKNYFEKNREKMRYGFFSTLELPIGSGAVESAIRRVINLRLKGPGIFWHEDTANEMLMLRSYYKANRWGLIRKMASTSAELELA